MEKMIELSHRQLQMSLTRTFFLLMDTSNWNERRIRMKMCHVNTPIGMLWPDQIHLVQKCFSNEDRWVKGIVDITVEHVKS